MITVIKAVVHMQLIAIRVNHWLIKTLQLLRLEPKQNQELDQFKSQSNHKCSTSDSSAYI